MPIPLTINSFILGYRNEEGKLITSNPFFHSLYDRVSAELGVMRYGFPVLRDSSRHGLYAVTYRCLIRGRIIHTLLRQNSDLTIDILDDGERQIESFTTIYDLIALIMWGDRTARRSPREGTGLMTALTPALVPILPAAIGALVGDASRAARVPLASRIPGSDEDPSS